MLARMNNCTSTLPSAKKRAAKGSSLLRRRSTLAHLGILFIYGTESLRQFTGRISHFTMLQNDIHYFVMLHDETDFLVMLQDEAHCCVILHNDETYFCNVTD